MVLSPQVPEVVGHIHLPKEALWEACDVNALVARMLRVQAFVDGLLRLGEIPMSELVSGAYLGGNVIQQLLVGLQLLVAPVLFGHERCKVLHPVDVSDELVVTHVRLHVHVGAKVLKRHAVISVVYVVVTALPTVRCHGVELLFVRHLDKVTVLVVVGSHRVRWCSVVFGGVRWCSVVRKYSLYVVCMKYVVVYFNRMVYKIPSNVLHPHIYHFHTKSISNINNSTFIHSNIRCILYVLKYKTTYKLHTNYIQITYKLHTNQEQT